MKDVMGLMKQAQAMQAKLAETQAELETMHVEGAVGRRPRARRDDREGAR